MTFTMVSQLLEKTLNEIIGSLTILAKKDSLSKIQIIPKNIPKYLGKANLQYQDTIWNTSFKIWCTLDINTLLIATPNKLNIEITPEDKNIILQMVNTNISKDLNLTKIQDISKNSKEYFKFLEDKDIQKTDESYKNIFKLWQSLAQDNINSINEREKILIDLEKILNQSIFLKLRQVILSFTSAKQLKLYLSENLHIKDKEKNTPKTQENISLQKGELTKEDVKKLENDFIQLKKSFSKEESTIIKLKKIDTLFKKWNSTNKSIMLEVLYQNYYLKNKHLEPGKIIDIILGYLKEYTPHTVASILIRLSFLQESSADKIISTELNKIKKILES